MTFQSLKRYALVPALLAVALPLAADEGMWMPQQIPDLASRLKALGFEADPASFADLTGHPMGAIIQIPGCTASFISAEGLIATNHHCVLSALQFNSTPQKNLIKEGFLAKAKEEELTSGPGSRASVTMSVKEITDEITGKIDPKLSDRARFDLLEKRTKERTAVCEKSGMRCQVSSFFGGSRFFEIAQMELQDVRLVYAPPEGIGVYGGETDNWRWPRHTGDFSLYRAYIGKDGKPAPYSKDNVPYHPAHHLTVSPKGVSPGDLVFVAGFPGRTSRLATYADVKETAEWDYPRAIRRAGDIIAILEKLAKESKETAIKVNSQLRTLGNGLTNRKGQLEGLVKGGLLAKKAAAEKDLAAWIAADPARVKEYGDVLPAMQKLQDETEKTRDRDATLGSLFQASQLLGTSETLIRLSKERPKKDEDRSPEFQERNWKRVRDGLERMDRSFDLGADRAVFRYTLLEAAKLPAAQRIPEVDKAFGLSLGQSEADAAKAIDGALDKLYVKPLLASKDERLKLFEATTATLTALKDPFVDLAMSLQPLREANRERTKTLTGALSRIRPRYMKAMIQKAGGLLAPDANSTLRVTYGKVEGVKSKDGLFYLPQTTLAGVVEKNTGEGDFDVPKRELDAVAALRAGKSTPFLDPKLGDVPVNFLSSVDTTGGNSGSATLNAKGEFVGLLFDGTYETIASDFLFDTEKTRSIHVDSRYFLWVLSAVDGGQNILDELGLGK